MTPDPDFQASSLRANVTRAQVDFDLASEQYKTAWDAAAAAAQRKAESEGRLSATFERLEAALAAAKAADVVVAAAKVADPRLLGALRTGRERGKILSRVIPPRERLHDPAAN